MSVSNSNDGFFEPEIINNYFVEITQVSHPSQDEDPVRHWVAQKIAGIKSKYQDNRSRITLVQYLPDATTPGERNILLRRDGDGVFAGHLPVILQAHLDMVAVPNEDIFPLLMETYRTEASTWLTAKGTTLGADNGIGVATILAFLEDETMKDVPIECVFTVQEEIDMGGARELDASKLTGKKFINLDAEDLTTLIYGSAGGCETRFQSSLTTESLTGTTAIKVSINGLRSGHSGIDINKGRLNAIKALAQMLQHLNKRIHYFDDGEGINTYDLTVADLKRADSIKPNSIPSAAEAIICVPSNMADSFIEDFQKLADLEKEMNQPVETSFVYEAIPVQCPQSLSRASTDALLLILNAIPNDVVRMIPSNPSLVETSSNVYDVTIFESKATIRASNRSSDLSSFARLKKLQENTGNLYGYTVESDFDAYPSWQPNENSELLKIAKKVYARLYGAENCEATIIHAGLECSWMIDKCGGEMECISIGTTIRNPHTTDESLQTIHQGKPTLVAFYTAVKEIVGAIVKVAKMHSQGTETALH